MFLYIVFYANYLDNTELSKNHTTHYTLTKSNIQIISTYLKKKLTIPTSTAIGNRTEKKITLIFSRHCTAQIGPGIDPGPDIQHTLPPGTHTRHYMLRTQCAREALKHTLARNGRYAVCKGRLALPVVLLQRVLSLINCISLRVFNNYYVHMVGCVCVMCDDVVNFKFTWLERSGRVEFGLFDWSFHTEIVWNYDIKYTFDIIFLYNLNKILNHRSVPYRNSI